MRGRVEYRLAQRSEAGLIADMSRSLIEAGLGWSWTPDRVDLGIVSAETTVLVAACDQHVAGFAIMEFGAAHAHLNLLAVQPRWQGAGIGRALVAWLEDSARVAGTFTVRLELRAANEGAHRFYRRFGYTEVSRVAGYYRGRETAIRMVHDLRTAPALIRVPRTPPATR
ncbi:MAG: GNAT family N-acetyltransferase [Pseudomonadota bacterium]|nr:MAG: GNAT family N-acetyltransferase [Pseudomonadota bacterium]